VIKGVEQDFAEGYGAMESLGLCHIELEEFVRVHQEELWPAHFRTPRYSPQGPTASRYW